MLIVTRRCCCRFFSLLRFVVAMFVHQRFDLLFFIYLPYRISCIISHSYRSIIVIKAVTQAHE
jgi:hypothetical protein